MNSWASHNQPCTSAPAVSSLFAAAACCWKNISRSRASFRCSILPSLETAKTFEGLQPLGDHASRVEAEAQREELIPRETFVQGRGSDWADLPVLDLLSEVLERTASLPFRPPS